MNQAKPIVAQGSWIMREVASRTLETLSADDGIVLWQVSHGAGEFDCAKSGTLRLTEGKTVVYTSPHPAQYSLATEECRALDIRLSPDFLDDVARTELGLPRAPDLPSQTRVLEDAALARLGRSLLQLSTGDQQDPITRCAVTRAIAARLLGHHLRTTPDGSRDGRVRRVIAYIEAHIDDALTLADLADLAGYSVFHFSRVFRTATGQTTKSYIRQRRVARARRLIETTNLPLVEVALCCGFAHQSHFTTVFQKETGVTPGDFRRSAEKHASAAR
ncbi:MAG: AraC family transcriptional regulator [Pseudomonadota bacterium]